MTVTDLTLDGNPFGPRDVTGVVRRGRAVRQGDGVAARMQAARQAVLAVAGRREVYGRTTGVGANSVVVVGGLEGPAAATGADHDRRLLLSHSTTSGEPYPDEVAAATMLVRANQLARGASGASPAAYAGLVAALRAGATPLLHRGSAVGTGDLGALAELGLTLVGERPWHRGAVAPVRLETGDVLPLLSSNAATVAEAALACADVADLLDATCAVAALTFVAARGNAEAFDPRVHAGRPQPGQAEVAATVRALLRGARLDAVRLQDPFGLRAFPQVHGPAVDAADRLAGVVAVETAAAAENPLVTLDPQPQVLHHGNWHEAPLSLALDGLRLAVTGSAVLSTRRLAMLVEPRWTGLPAFLADTAPGAEGSSGAMALEYVAAAAAARLRALAAPVSLGSAVLSRGVEDSASFAPEAARAAADAVAPLRTVLACELVAVTRALRLDHVTPGHLGRAPVAGAVELAYDTLPAELADRSLTGDVRLAESLLPALAALARDADVTDE